MPSPVDPQTLASLLPWIDRFAGTRILVWGDLVADRFLHGTTTRVSREAPALVLRYDSEEIRPGGAGNAALNAAALGANVAVFGYVGADNEGARLLAALDARDIDTSGVAQRSDSSTPVKTRVMAGGVHTVRQQILRIDNDRGWSQQDPSDDALLASLAQASTASDALLISDYGLGSVSPQMYARLRPQLRPSEWPITLDSRFDITAYHGVTAATPNESEVEGSLRVSLNGDTVAVERAGAELLEQIGAEHLIITRGSHGMAIFSAGREPVHLGIYGTNEIADVTGAGDTVIATLTLGLAAGAGIEAAAQLANVAAGLAVLKHGTATVPQHELVAALLASA